MNIPSLLRIAVLVIVVAGFMSVQSRLANERVSAQTDNGRVDASFPPSIAKFLPVAPANFVVPPIFTTDDQAREIAAADFNGDGKIDLAITNAEGIDILLGNGDGSFQPKRLVAVAAFGILVADMNNDGIPDLVVTTERYNNTSGLEVLLGNGDGSFGARHSYPIGQYSTSIAVGDFNGDGNLDVAVAEPADYSVLVLPGDGEGSLGEGTAYRIPGGRTATPNSVVTGDFNDDGNLDIAVANGALFILYGNGDGTFQSPKAIVESLSLDVGDMNNDGRLDIVTNTGVLLNEGGGSFSFHGYKEKAALGILAVGDFNGDGIPDLVSENVGIMLGRGDGTFKAVRDTYSEGPTAGFLAAADFNGDGKLDLAQIASAYSGGVASYLGNGDGTLRAVRSYSDGTSAALQATADFNNDAKMDVAVIGQNNSGDPTVSILLGDAQGTLNPLAPTALTVSPISAIPGDFDNDGNIDIALLAVQDIVILPGNGDGTFKAPVISSLPFETNAMAVADFDHNGTLDIAVLQPCLEDQFCPSNVLIYLGNGDGTFKAGGTFEVGTYSVGIVTADFNNDGIPDLAVDNEVESNGHGSVSLLLGNGDGTFQPQTFISDAGKQPTNIAVADFNADGNKDILVVNNGGIVTVYFGLGNGRFSTHVSTTGITAGPMTIADFNGDGFPDLAVGASGIQVYTGIGNGKFQPPIALLAGDAQAYSIQAAFLGPSTLPDIVVPTSDYQQSVDVINNLGN